MILERILLIICPNFPFLASKWHLIASKYPKFAVPWKWRFPAKPFFSKQSPAFYTTLSRNTTDLDNLNIRISEFCVNLVTKISLCLAIAIFTSMTKCTNSFPTASRQGIFTPPRISTIFKVESQKVSCFGTNSYYSQWQKRHFFWFWIFLNDLKRHQSFEWKFHKTFWRTRAISIKGLYAKMAKLSYIRQINRGNELLLLKESKVRLKVILSG